MIISSQNNQYYDDGLKTTHGIHGEKLLEQKLRITHKKAKEISASNGHILRKNIETNRDTKNNTKLTVLQ